MVGKGNGCVVRIRWISKECHPIHPLFASFRSVLSPHFCAFRRLPSTTLTISHVRQFSPCFPVPCQCHFRHSTRVASTCGWRVSYDISIWMWLWSNASEKCHTPVIKYIVHELCESDSMNVSVFKEFNASFSVFGSYLLCYDASGFGRQCFFLSFRPFLRQ